jgi:hypothetical protein
MKTFKIKLHSFVDVITNSSTEIFVRSEKCIQPAKEMFAELLKLIGENKSVDEIFDIKIDFEDPDDHDYKYDEVNENDLEETSGDTVLIITVKDKKYENLCEKLIKLIYSVEQSEIYC